MNYRSKLWIGILMLACPAGAATAQPAPFADAPVGTCLAISIDTKALTPFAEATVKQFFVALQSSNSLSTQEKAHFRRPTAGVMKAAKTLFTKVDRIDVYRDMRRPPLIALYGNVTLEDIVTAANGFIKSAGEPAEGVPAQVVKSIGTTTKGIYRLTEFPLVAGVGGEADGIPKGTVLLAMDASVFANRGAKNVPASFVAFEKKVSTTSIWGIAKIPSGDPEAPFGLRFQATLTGKGSVRIGLEFASPKLAKQSYENLTKDIKAEAFTFSPLAEALLFRQEGPSLVITNKPSKVTLAESIGNRILPTLIIARRMARVAAMSMNLACLGKAITLYTCEHNRWPDSMEVLVTEGMIEGQYFFYPGEYPRRKLNKSGFPADGGDVVFLPVGNNLRLVNAYVDPKFVRNDRISVLLTDGSVKVFKLEEAIEHVQATHKWMKKYKTAIPARSVTALKALQKMAKAAAAEK